MSTRGCERIGFRRRFGLPHCSSTCASWVLECAKRCGCDCFASSVYGISEVHNGFCHRSGNRRAISPRLPWVHHIGIQNDMTDPSRSISFTRTLSFLISTFEDDSHALENLVHSGLLLARSHPIVAWEKESRHGPSNPKWSGGTNHRRLTLAGNPSSDGLGSVVLVDQARRQKGKGLWTNGFQGTRSTR